MSVRYAKRKKYYDKDKGWFCFGNINAQGTCYYFATHTIAVISQNDLKAI